MMKTMNKKVVFSPDTKHKIQSWSSGGAKVSRCSKKRVATMNNASSRDYPNRSSSSKEFSLSALRFLKRVGAKVAKALSYVSSGKKWSRKVSAAASSSSAGLARSWSYAESSMLDSQRAEAIEDCIEFLNSSSSSSLQRSFSATSCSSR